MTEPERTYAMFDLEPAAHRIADLIGEVTDERLGLPTPSDGMSVGDLLDHIVGLTLAFRYCAAKAGEEVTSQPPRPASVDNLEPGWRDRLPSELDALVAAWRKPAAWEGMAQAGGVTLPAPVMGLVVLDELVMHGWDLARSLDRPYGCDPEVAAALVEFLSEGADDQESREGMFGPVVPVPPDAPAFDRALGLAGREPGWTPPPA